MPDTKISALPAAGAAAAANELAINEAGTSKKLTVSQIAAFIYPVGCLYVSTVSTNPATIFGFGTWAAFGAGRVLVGLDSGDTDFDVSEETGGAKTSTPSAHTGAAVANHVFTQPSAHTNHVFTQPSAHADVLNHLHTLATGTGATGNFSQVLGTVDSSSGGTGGTPTQTALGTLSGNPTANGVASQAHAGGAVDAHSAHSGGAVDAHGVTQPSAHAALSVVQPYVVVYFWKRTA